MKISGRQDLLPLAGLALAILVLFSAPLTRVFSYARRVEEQSGLAVLPALVVLAASLGRPPPPPAARRRRPTPASPRLSAGKASVRAEEVERLIAYGQALGRANDLESIRVSIAQHLPTLAGTERVWVLIREGTQWEALAGDTRGTNEVLRVGRSGRAAAYRPDQPRPGGTGDRVPADGGLGGHRRPRRPHTRRRAAETSAVARSRPRRRVLALAIRHAQLAREVQREQRPRRA